MQTKAKRVTRPTSHGSILVPTDFSRAARWAIARACRLSLGRRARIHFLHVLPPSQWGSQSPDKNEIARRSNHAATLLAKAAHTAGADVSQTQIRVLKGEPYVEIIRYAREIDAKLIILGRRGAGQHLRRRLGTTAARVLHMSDTPVLCVGKPPRGPYWRPLIALPLDPSARDLVDLVRHVAAEGSQVIHGVRAYHVPFTGFISAGSDEHPTAHHQYFKDEAARSLKELVATLKRRGVQIDAVLRHGDARSIILDEARRMRADLIAVGTHARSGVAHALLGSVAEWVIVNADSDVLVARPVRFTFEIP